MSRRGCHRPRLLAVVVVCLAAAGPSLSSEARLGVTSSAQVGVPAWHFRTGVPFAAGELTDPGTVRLYRGTRQLAVQAEALATWGPPESDLGGSIKWLGVDFVDSIASGVKREYRLEWGGPTAARKAPPLARELDDGIIVRNGRLEILFRKGGPSGFNLFESVKLDGEVMLPAGGAPRGAFIQDGAGATYWAAHDPTAEVRVERNGPVAAVIRAEGWFANPESGHGPVAGEPAPRPKGGLCRYVTRIYIGAGLPGVRVQHTFILTEDSSTTTYRDIGIALPFALDGDDSAAGFGGVQGRPPSPRPQAAWPSEASAKEGRVAGHVYLLQRSSDEYVVRRIGRDGSRTEIAAGEKAPGWVEAGGLGIGVRDFWQNFPKELEVVPQTPSLMVHLWPRHGGSRMETAETIDVLNAWRLPFVHSGEALDFRIPPVYLSEKMFGNVYGYMGRHRYQSIGQGVHANALGIAKTHELWIDFDGEGFEDRFSVFQLAPHVLAEPTYVETTHAFGPLAAADHDRFPLSEMRFSRGMKAIIRMHDHIKGYGMWNYRGLHHRLTVRKDEWTADYYRLWAGFHHGYARVPWWLYVRGGDPEFLDFARANTQKLADVGLCHWTNARFENAREECRKRVGGMCDYKGFVPWNRGDRYGYNSMIDPFLYDYYLTGNLRSWDVALEHGYYVAKCLNTEHGGRNAAGQADTMTNLYVATWDPEIRPRMVQACRDMMKRLPHEQHAPHWTPWLTRYWDTTRDEKAKRYLLDWVESGKFTNDGLDKVACAYYITGDPRHAKRCAERLLYRGSYMYYKEGDFFDAGLASGWYEWAFMVRDEMLAMKAAQQIKLTYDDLPGSGYNVLSPRRETPGRRQKLVIAFRHDGTRRDVTLGTSFQYKPTTSRLYGPSGDLIRRATHAIKGGKRTGRGHPQMTVPLGDGGRTGIYYLVYENAFSFRPLLPEGDLVWMRTGPDAVFCLRRGRAFFLVPRGVEAFRLQFEPGYTTGPLQYRFLAAGSVFDPDLKCAQHVACGNDSDPQIVQQRVRVEHRAKVWSLVGNDYIVLTNTEGIPPWVSHTHRAFGDPDLLPPKELPGFVK